MRVALDTNILAYAEGLGDERRCQAALSLVGQLPVGLALLPAQALGELYRVLTGKAKRKPDDARAAVLSWASNFPPPRRCSVRVPPVHRSNHSDARSSSTRRPA